MNAASLVLLVASIALVATQMDGRKRPASPRPKGKFDDASGRIDPGKGILQKIRILIIGGGAQAVAVLGQLRKFKPPSSSKKGKKEPHSITVIEKNKEFGPGLPYSNERGVLTDEHLLNVFFTSGIDITTTTPDASQRNDYQKWLNPNPVSNADPNAQMETPPQRKKVGRYLNQRFYQFARQCESNGFKMDLIDSKSADYIEQYNKEPNYYIVTLNDGYSIQAHDVVLATGHWDWSRFSEKAGERVLGYYKSPWPASEIQKIPANQHIASYGASLSAVDLALTLALNFGKFTPKGDGFEYEFNDKSKTFELTMYSRTGQLPTVSGDLSKSYVKTKMTDQAVEQLLRANKGILPLDDVFQLMKEDLVNQEKQQEDAGQQDGLPSATKSPDFWQMKFDEFFRHVDDILYPSPTTAVGRLRTNIDRARRSIQTGSPLTLQSFFYSSRRFLNLYSKYLPGEDARRFREQMVSQMLRVCTPMPLSNAEKMLALIIAGVLHLQAVGSDNQVLAGDNNVGVKIEYGGNTVYHRYFVEALGQSGDLGRDPSTLTQSLFDNKLAERLSIPYLDNKEGKKAYRAQKDRKSGKIEKIGRNYFYKTDGVKMNIDVNRVIPPEGSAASREKCLGPIYATGPFAFGYFPFGQALSAAVMSAERIVEDMKRRRRFEEV